MKKFISILLFVTVMFWLFRKKIMAIYKDAISYKRIDTLHPSIRMKVKLMLNDAISQGIKLRVTQATRTDDEQNRLYNQVPKVTNAKAGDSFHNYGLAFDVAIMDKDDNPIWDYNNLLWQKVGELGKKYGFVWGGDFKSFKDYPHFQEGNSITFLKQQKVMKNFDSEGFINIT